MTFNISFKLTDESASLNDLINAGFTIEQAEQAVKNMVTEVLEDELGDEMTFSCLRVEYDG